MLAKTKVKILTCIVIYLLGCGTGFMVYAKFFDKGVTIKKIKNKVSGRNNNQDIDQTFNLGKHKK